MKPLMMMAALIVAVPAFAADDHGDDHHHEEHVTAGPNGGHVVRSSAHFAFEVVVDKQRMARITMLDDHGKATSAAGVEIHGIAGERSAPVKLTFAAADGGVLVSDRALPDGAHIPMILVIKTNPDAKAVTERFELHVH